MTAGEKRCAHKVLVVDDTKNIRMLLTKCLELEGYTVSSAANGKEALDCIYAESYDLIFLDIKLPEISGTEVLRRMRGANIQTPVIMITAYPTIKNAVECTRLGVVCYLQKPFTAERLKNVLRELEEAGEIGNSNVLEAADAAMGQGEVQRALALLRNALSANPQDPDIYEGMAQAYQLMGELESAKKFRQIAALLR